MKSNFWKKYFRVYDTLNYLIPYQELMSSLIKELDIKSGEKILDVGCGTGNLAVKIEGKGGDLWGTDYCKEALDICKNRVNSKNILLHNALEPFPFEDDFFDKIVSNNTIYTFNNENQRKILIELKRVLRPGGKIIISNPKEGWKPVNIYKEGIKQDMKQNGLLKTIVKILRIIIPTIKIFYYNIFIQKESSYLYRSIEDQKKLLEDMGFINVSDGHYVYGKEAILHSAKK